MTETRAFRLIAASPDNKTPSRIYLLQATRPHPAFGAEPGVPYGGAGCARRLDGKQQLSEGMLALHAHPQGLLVSSSGRQPAAGCRLRNNSILPQLPVLWAHLAPFGRRGRPPQMRLLRTTPVLASPSLRRAPCGTARCEEHGLEPTCTPSTSESLLPCPGAPEHPPGSPTAHTEGRAAPWETSHAEQLVPAPWELRVQPGADPAPYRAAGCPHSPVPKPPSPCPSQQS